MRDSDLQNRIDSIITSSKPISRTGRSGAPKKKAPRKRARTAPVKTRSENEESTLALGEEVEYNINDPREQNLYLKQLSLDLKPVASDYTINNSGQTKRDDALLSSPRELSEIETDNDSKVARYLRKQAMEQKIDNFFEKTPVKNVHMQHKKLKKKAERAKKRKNPLHQRGHEQKKSALDDEDSDNEVQDDPFADEPKSTLGYLDSARKKRTQSESQSFKSVSREKRDKVMDNIASNPPVGYYNPKHTILDSRVAGGKVAPIERHQTRSAIAKSRYEAKLAKAKAKQAAFREKATLSTTPKPSKTYSTTSSESEGKKKRKIKKFGLDREWVERRKDLMRNKKDGLSTLKSTTNRSQTISQLNVHLDYWPACDSSNKKFSNDAVMVDMKNQVGRDKFYKIKTHDPIYAPNYESLSTSYRKSRGKHGFKQFADRTAASRGSQRNAADVDKGDIAYHKFYESNHNVKFKKMEGAFDLDKFQGREDPRNNYLLAIEGSRKKKGKVTKADKDAERVRSSGTHLGGYTPIEVESKNVQNRFCAYFGKQTGRKFDPHAVLTDLSYDVEYGVVDKNIKGHTSMSRQVSRKPLINQTMASKEAADFYDSKIENTSKQYRAPIFDFGKGPTRDQLGSLKIKSMNDLVYDKAMDQQFKTFNRTTGNPFMRQQLGRADIERRFNGKKRAPDKFYTDQNETLDKFKEKQLQGANLNFEKMTNRYEKFGAPKRDIHQSINKAEKPFIIRGTPFGAGLSDAPPVGNYQPKYTVLDVEPTVPKIGPS